MSNYTDLARGETGTANLNQRLRALQLSTTVAVANTGTPDGVAHVTGQVVDANGNSVAGRFLVKVWFAATANAAAADLGELAAKANTVIITEHTTDSYSDLLTHSDGSWGVELTTAANGTVHANALVVSAVASDSEAITGNE